MDFGNVTLNNATLELTLGSAYATQPAGTIDVLINGTPADSTITGEFAQGTSITASNGDVFDIAYGENATDTGSGDDVLLIATGDPAPASPDVKASGHGVRAGGSFFSQCGIWQPETVCISRRSAGAELRGNVAGSLGSAGDLPVCAPAQARRLIGIALTDLPDTSGELPLVIPAPPVRGMLRRSLRDNCRSTCQRIVLRYRRRP